MNKKTIVHIITGLKIGGAEALMVDFLSHPAASAYHHYVLYFYDGPNRTLLEERGIVCYHVKGWLWLYDPLFFIRVVSLIKSLQPDCIHTWLWSANCIGRIIGKFLKIPVINSLHSELTLDGKVRNTLDFYTSHMADRIIAVSYGVAESLLKNNKQPLTHKVSIIKNGIDVQKINRQSQQLKVDRALLNLNPEHFVIGSVGRWVTCKNYSFLIDLFSLIVKKNVHARLLLIGTGELKETLQKQAHLLNLQDSILFIEGARALGYYPLMDCFIQTTFKEGISIALLEAMSCSLPCIVVQNGPSHDVLIHEENGIIVPLHDLTLSSQALETIMYNKKFATLLAHNAFETVKKDFGLDSMIHAYQSEYDLLMH